MEYDWSKCQSSNVLGVFWMNDILDDIVEFSRKVASGRKVAGAIRSMVNVRSQQLKFARVMPETLLLPVLLYSSETMVWREKEMSRISTVQMDSLRYLLSIRRMDRVPNLRIRELCEV